MYHFNSIILQLWLLFLIIFFDISSFDSLPFAVLFMFFNPIFKKSTATLFTRNKHFRVSHRSYFFIIFIFDRNWLYFIYT